MALVLVELVAAALQSHSETPMLMVEGVAPPQDRVEAADLDQAATAVPVAAPPVALVVLEQEEEAVVDIMGAEAVEVGVPLVVVAEEAEEQTGSRALLLVQPTTATVLLGATAAAMVVRAELL